MKQSTECISLSINTFIERINSWTYTGTNNACTNFANIERVIVSTAAFGVRVDKGGVLPCLWEATIVEENITLFELLVGYRKFLMEREIFLM